MLGVLVAATVALLPTRVVFHREDGAVRVAGIDSPPRQRTHGALRERPRRAVHTSAARPPIAGLTVAVSPKASAVRPSRDTIRTERQRSALPPGYQTSIPDAPLVTEPLRSPVGTPGLYELQLGRLARRVVRVYESETGVLLPIAEFLELAEIGHQGGAGALSGRLEPDGQRFRFDIDAHAVRIGERVLRPGPRDLAVVDGELYGSLPLLGELFDVSAAVDREAATVFVHNPEGLPIARRLKRQAARAILIGGEHTAAPELILRGRGGAWDGVVVSYELHSSSHDPRGETGYDLGMATGAAAGSVLLRLRGSPEGPSRFEGAWTGIWPTQRWMTQLRVGDGASTGPRPAASRGISVTNAPFARPLLVEDLPFSGTLPPDWSLEAYRGGRLIGFDSVGQSGKYLLTLPVQYGENPVDFVAYGPIGEIRTFNRTFRALPSMLPPGAFEYGISAGGCRSTTCAAIGNLDLRYGLSRRLTVRGGFDRYWRTSSPGFSHPYASVVAAPTNALSLELEGIAHALMRAGVRIEPSIGLRLTADYVDYAGGSSGSPFVLAGIRRQWSVDGRVSPTPRSGALVLEAAGTRIETSGGSHAEARVGASVRASNMLVRPYVRLDHSATGGQAIDRRYLGVEATILPRVALGPVLGAVWAQGRLEAEDARRPTRAALILARNFGRSLRAESGVRWERGASGGAFTLSLVSQFDAFRSASLVTAPTGGQSARLDQSVGGSVVWSRSADMALSSEPGLDRGGIAGRVFLDVNADGRRQDDEPVLPGTRVLVVNRWLTADSEGHYQVWGLSPYQDAIVAADTTSLASPWWVPAFGSASVLPAPNSFRTLDLPILIGGIVEGSLMLDGPTSLPSDRGFTLTLIESTTGAKTTLETFSDGSFYRSGLRPGHYTATVDSSALASLRLIADSVHFTLAALAGEPGESGEQRRESARRRAGPTVSGLRITLRPAP
jgi:hypothetical protein